MTEQVRTVKNILNAAYTSCKFDVRLKRAKDYARSSDRVIVTTEDLVVDRVIETLRKHVIGGIAVGQYGKQLWQPKGKSPWMLDPTTKKTVDFDLCEFIEVKNPWQ